MTPADDGFRWMRVTASTRIAPRMQRLRLQGEALHRFDTNANLHVRLHVPADPTTRFPETPTGPRGALLGAGVATRYYTIRRIDAAAGWVDIDFVLHEAPGPAGDFARDAHIGDICGMSGPCGLGVKPARSYLLAGDDTALPAIARIAENLPADATGTIFVEVETPEDRLPFSMPPGMACQWLFRRASGVAGVAGFCTHVERAIAIIAAGPPNQFVWIATEFSAYERLREPLKVVAKARSICVPYWRADPN